MAAVSVSNRVSEELGDGNRQPAGKPGKSVKNSSKTDLCGYTVRLDSQTGPNTVLEYVTIGVLLRRIQATKGLCLLNYSHVVVDEVHERSVDSDLLLMLLREYKGLDRARDWARARATGNTNGTNDTTGTTGNTTGTDGTSTNTNTITNTNIATDKPGSSRPFPRIVLMSATADVEAISSYWSSASAGTGSASGSSADSSATSSGSNNSGSSNNNSSNGTGTVASDTDTATNTNSHSNTNTNSHSNTNSNSHSYSIANITIPGRTFPVQSCYIEDCIEGMGLVYDVRYSNKNTQYQYEKQTQAYQDETHGNNISTSSSNSYINSNASSNTSNLVGNLNEFEELACYNYMLEY